MKHRQIKTSFWEDGYTLKLSKIEKLFFIYLFTNPKVNMVGIYELPDILILPTLGCTLEELEKMKQKFEKDEKYFFYDGWVYINNFSKHNKYSSAQNVVDSYLRDFNSIPIEVLNHFLVVKKLNYIPTICEKEKVTVKVMVMVKEGSPYPTIQAINDNSELDLDEIDEGIRRLK